MHAARRSTERAQAHAAHDRSRTPAAQSADDTSAALCAAASAALGVDLGPDSFQGSALARYQRSWSASTPAEVLTKRLRWLADKLGERAAQRILLGSPPVLLFPEAQLGNKVGFHVHGQGVCMQLANTAHVYWMEHMRSCLPHMRRAHAAHAAL
jgi:hypothetical protein